VLSAWDNFYVIVGSSAAGLTGLMFVVVTLLSGSRVKGSFAEIHAFGTPTVVHFSAVLLISAILSAPWQDAADAAHLTGAVAIAGIVYGLVIVKRGRKQTGYTMTFDDVIFYEVLPPLGYAGLLIASAGLRHHHPWALFAIAAVALLLLLISVRNAWDTITYIVLTGREERNQP
jgi:hypothetical protein